MAFGLVDSEEHESPSGFVDRKAKKKKLQICCASADMAERPLAHAYANAVRQRVRRNDFLEGRDTRKGIPTQPLKEWVQILRNVTHTDAHTAHTAHTHTHARRHAHVHDAILYNKKNTCARGIFADLPTI